MQYTAILNPTAIGSLRANRVNAFPYVIMGRYEVALAGRIFAGT
jgi:hypothetical protein